MLQILIGFANVRVFKITNGSLLAESVGGCGASAATEYCDCDKRASLEILDLASVVR